MKKLLIALAAVLVTVASYGQGQVVFGNLGGGVNAPVSFSGLAPGFFGLYQVNVQIPQNAPVSGAAAVVLTIGGVASNAVTIAVQ